MNKRILAAFTAIAVAASTLTFMSFAADDSNTQDGVPIQQGTFEGSDFYTNRALDVANDFHLFAFDTIDLHAHCNGNFAAPNVKAPQASGTASGSLANSDGVGTDPDMQDEVSLASESIELEADCKVDYLFFPMTCQLFDEIGNSLSKSDKVIVDSKTGKVSNPNGDSKGNISVGKPGNQHSISGSIGYINKDYIDFNGKYKTFYNDMSNELATLTDTSKKIDGVTYITAKNLGNGYGEITLADSGISVLNIDIKTLNSFQNGFDFYNVITVEDNDGDGRPEYKMSSDGKTSLQTLIINLDVGTNKPTDPDEFNAELKIHRTIGEVVNNEENNALDGTNILWNIYDSSDENNLCTGTFTFRKNLFGSVLAPSAWIVAQGSGMNGNVIANTIETHAESHRCDFIGALPSFTSTTPGGNEGSGTDPSGTDPSDSDPSDSDPSDSDPSDSDPSDSDPSGTDPSGSDPSGSDPSGTDPSGTDPSGSDPSGTDPSGTDPSGTDPSGTDPSGTDPSGTDPSGTDPSGTDPSGTDPSGTDPSGNENSGVGDENDDNDKNDPSSNDKVDDDNDNNNKPSGNVSSENNEGVANGGDGNDRNTGIGNDGDANNRPPKTGDSAPAALALALIGSALVITAAKKGKEK